MKLKTKKLFKNELSPKLKNNKISRVIIWTLIIAITGSLVLFTPVFKTREIVIRNENIENKPVINLGQLGAIIPPLLGNKERVNLLFLGIPGEGNSAPNLTDTIIILNTTPKGENPIAISIPRDFLVKFPDKAYYTKINSLYKWGGTGEQGIKLLIAALREITGLEIDYFVVLDLHGVEKIVDKVGGIDIYVKNDIYDPLFPDPYNSYQTFSLGKGNQHLNGETALKYIRTRYDAGGDFARIERQQQVINALKNKIMSLNPFWDMATVLSIWNALNKNTYSNIGMGDIKYIWNLTKKTNFDEIDFFTLKAQPGENQLLVSGTITLGGQTASILKPRIGIGNYEEIKSFINQLINP